MKVYSKEDYIELAKAVIAGMPMNEAEKILEQQRQIKARGEQVFWLTLQSDGITTIQLTKATKEKLGALKQNKETFEDVVIRLMHENTSNSV